MQTPDTSFSVFDLLRRKLERTHSGATYPHTKTYKHNAPMDGQHKVDKEY